MYEELVKKLKNCSECGDCYICESMDDAIKEAADVIEKLEKELKLWHTVKINDAIEDPTAAQSGYCCHNCDHKDEYIEELQYTIHELEQRGR